MQKRFLIISAFLLTLLLSCAVDEVFKDPNGILEDEYERKDAPEVFLSSLDVTSDKVGPIVPNFSREVFKYEVGIPTGTTTVTLKAEVLHPERASITINDQPVRSGDVSAPIQLNDPTNHINVAVTALDGSSFVYKLDAIKVLGTANDDTTLSSLALSTGAFGFLSSKYDYILEVETNVNSVVITPTANNTSTSKVYVNGSLLPQNASVPAGLGVGMNRIEVQVVSAKLTSAIYTLNITRLTPEFYGLLITEWAGIYTKDDCEDFIELRNFGSRDVTITTNLRIYIGTTAIALTKYGTTTSVSSYVTLGSAGVKIKPGEVILVVKKEITSDYIGYFLNPKTASIPKTPAGTKFFLASEKKLIGTRKKLHESQAYLELGEEYTWSYTPDPEIMVQNGLNSTVSKLKPGFTYGIDATDDVGKWQSGNKNTRSPGTYE